MYEKATTGTLQAGSQYANQASEKQQPRLLSVQDRLGNVWGRLVDIETRMTLLSERLLGSVPIGVGTASPKEAAQPPVVRRLEDISEDLGMKADQIHGVLVRLETLA